MSNLEILQKLTLGKKDTKDVTIELNGESYDFTIRPLTDGELSELKALEKKPLIVKVNTGNGRRQSVTTENVDINTGEFEKSQNEAKFKAISLSLSIDEDVPVEMIKQLPAGLPDILFKEIINVSSLTEKDLSLIKSFQQNE